MYPKYATSERLYEFEREAKENQAWVWKLPENERVKPWEWRKSKNNKPIIKHNIGAITIKKNGLLFLALLLNHLLPILDSASHLPAHCKLAFQF